LYKFQQNIKVTSKELHHAREVIVTQGNSIKIIETEKFTMQAKFKEDLQRITMSMRHEIERLRDIMQNQWIEMKYLREQNQTVRQDVKDIRNLLSIAQPDSYNTYTMDKLPEMFCLKQDKDGLKTLQSVRFGMTDTALFDKMFFFPLAELSAKSVLFELLRTKVV
jgi:hypothetical protein